MSISSFQAFPITEFKTGQFDYLKPWISPADAFEPLDNAFVYRGVLQKRPGYELWGVLRYQNNEIIDNGDGGAAYSGTFSDFPVETGSVSFTAQTSAGLETWSDNSDGTLTGSLGDTGTVSYTTGAWTMTLGGGRTIANTIPIVGTYTFTPTANTTPVERPIMGITNYSEETTNSQTPIVCDTDRMCYYNFSTDVFVPINTVSQVIYNGYANPATTGAITTGWTNLNPYGLSITDGTSTVIGTPTSATAGTLGAAGNITGGTYNFSTGSITVTFGGGGAFGDLTATFSMQGDYFTGDNTNFFNSVNWRPNTDSTNYLYLTNNVNQVTRYDGTNMDRPRLAITQTNHNAYTNDIAKCLDVKVYKQRLLLIRPTITGNGYPDAQSIRWSAQRVPTNFIADITGNGGELSATTSDWIQGDEFLRDVLIVFFQDTVWTFRFTGNQFDPFRYDKINSSMGSNAPYGTVDYENYVGGMGVKGLILCDGVNVERYDQNIIDQFTQIRQAAFAQCFTRKFDTLNQAWMLFVSLQNTLTNKSDKAIVFNTVEKSWSTFTIALSCLGITSNPSDARWQDYPATSWESAEWSWNSYLNDPLSPILAGGGHTGRVYILNKGDTDDGTSYQSTLLSKKWSPYAPMGMQSQFAYVDIYYQINPDVTLNIYFYPGNSQSSAVYRRITLDGPVSDQEYWQRVYIGIIDQFVTMEITSDGDGNFQILGMILWARPAGRLTP